MTNPRLVLASASPRRRELLRAGDVEFEVFVSGVDESAFARGAPRSVALKTALAKADDVAQQLKPVAPRETLVLAADTIVVLDDQIFGKPDDRHAARTMLQRLGGRTHSVLTGVALQRVDGEALVDVAEARVTFHPLSEALLAAYLASGEADDKAGAYGIQGLGAQLVRAVEGDLTGVIGLPLGLVNDFYAKLAGRPLFNGLQPRAIARRAFRELDTLPPACLLGIPD